MASLLVCLQLPYKVEWLKGKQGSDDNSSCKNRKANCQGDCGIQKIGLGLKWLELLRAPPSPPLSETITGNNWELYQKLNALEWTQAFSLVWNYGRPGMVWDKATWYDMSIFGISSHLIKLNETINQQLTLVGTARWLLQICMQSVQLSIRPANRSTF